MRSWFMDSILLKELNNEYKSDLKASSLWSPVALTKNYEIKNINI